MYVSKAVLCGYCLWLGYQAHKHDVIGKAVTAGRELMEEISYHNGVAFAEGIAKQGVIQIARPPAKVSDAAS